jgi:ATP-binding cassette subfamily F protein 3
MSLLSLNDVAVSFGANDIVTGVACEANPGDRIGLVGRNGAGKTSLLRILSGAERPSQGQRHAARWLRIEMVEQIPPTTDNSTTVREEVLTAVRDVVALETALHEAAAAMADGDADAAESYAHLLHRMESEGAFTYENRFAQIMSGIGFSEADWDRPLSILSGGQRSRVGLARALMAEPDLLLMDEPTNHLDIEGLRWLEAFLAAWQGAIIVTSHDRYFLDKVANRIWQVDNRRLRTYPGNYTHSEELRSAEAVRLEQEYERQQEMIRKEEEFIRRFGAGTRASQAQSRANKLARLDRIEAPRKEQRAARFRLTSKRSGEVVLRTDGFVAGYEHPVVKGGDLELERRARIALVGRNGSGKTTLLKTVAGEIAPLSGRLSLGSAVSLAHYWQEAEGLDPSLTVLEELLRDDPDIQATRDLAGRFLFSGDDVQKRVSSLSGGERSRLALAKLVRSGANLILLDEPTNHLDIPSREALEEALSAFEGTLIFASHDRRLIERLATRLWIVEDGVLVQFDGSLEEYERRRDETASRNTAATKQAPTADTGNAPAMSAYRRNQRIAELEEQIEAAEVGLKDLELQINEASTAGKSAEVGRLGLAFEALRTDLDKLLEEWASLG